MPVVTDFTELQAACQTSGTVQVANNITLLNYITIPNTADVTIESLTGNQTLYAPDSIHLYALGDGTQGGGAKLTLQNITLDGSHTHGGVHLGYTYLNPSAGGTLILNSGAIIQNCLNTTGFSGGDGAGIGMRGGIMEMHDGAIIQDNINSYGAAGGIDLENNMYPPYIGSQLKMTGGLITRNSAKTSGGGVNITQGATFLMTGGTISYNKAHHGGGVQIDANLGESSFTMNNETGQSLITHNYSQTFGGGVALNSYVASGTSTFDFQDGSITYNQAGEAGGGIGIADWTFSEEHVESGIRIVNQSGGIIAHNTAPFGGGVLISDLDESELTALR